MMSSWLPAFRQTVDLVDIDPRSGLHPIVPQTRNRWDGGRRGQQVCASLTCDAVARSFPSGTADSRHVAQRTDIPYLWMHASTIVCPFLMRSVVSLTLAVVV